MIMAIDPGGTTGVAFHADQSEGGKGYLTCVTHTPDELWNLFEFGGKHPEVVICEDFQTGNRINPIQHYTIRLVGGIQALCSFLQVPLYMQSPQNRKAFLKDAEDILKRDGRKFMEHEKDALAHLLRWEWTRDGNKQN